MTNELFLSLPKNDLLVGAKESYQNATIHFKTAEKASADGNFGIANSLLILSVEECIKSMLLTAGFFGIKIPFSVEPFFYDHKAKHNQAAEIQPLLNKLWIVKDSVIEILRNRKSRFRMVINLTLTWVFIAIGLKDMPLDDFTDWWKQANDQKNNGFYVGYRNSKWSLPSETLSASYEKTLSMAKPFIECLQLVNELQPNDYKILDPSYKFPDEDGSPQFVPNNE